VSDDCQGFPERCGDDELCVDGQCESDPCFGVDCTGDDEYCFEGDCVTSCADITCADGQVCVLGMCRAEPCGGVCLLDQVCNEGTNQCVDDPCRGVNCGVGEVCDDQTGDCERDPCLGVDCPGQQVCREGSCFAPPGSDAGVGSNTYVAPGGGGGCRTSGGSGWGGALLALLAIARLVRRRGR
jgi:hypothetical protein